VSQTLPVIDQGQTPYDQLVTQFENHLYTHSLRKLPHDKNNKFKVTIIYGSRGIPRHAESKTFSSMEDLEEWITPRGHHGELLLQEREIGSRTKFGQDIFEYDHKNIAERKLYLTRIRFKIINKMITIFDITFFDSFGA